MRNVLYASRISVIIGGLLMLVSSFMFAPQSADAASISQQLTKRLCDRQSVLSNRLTRALIDPALCNPTPTPEPTLTFTANPTTISQGGISTLTWSTTNATGCTASNGWSGSKATSGSQVVTPNATTTYALSCSGAGGTVSKSVTVNVTTNPTPTPSLVFNANPTSVAPNGTSTLTWDSTNANTCVASGGWSGSKSLDGTQQVNPNATTTYTLACGNGNSTSTQSVTVNVVPNQNPQPTVMLFSSRTSVTPGTSTATTTLSWSSTNASVCTASGGTWTGSKALSGTEVVTPTATTTYQLTCTGPGGSASDDVVVNFVPAAASTTALQFTASRTNLTQGSASVSTSTLSWDSTNATTCVASNGWSGSKALDGSETVQPTGTSTITYVLTCTGAGGPVTQSVTLTVGTTTPTVNISANPTNVTPGAGSATSTLTWTSQNGSFCLASGGWSGERAPSGTLVVQPSATTTYTLNCSNSIGTTTASATVNFVPAATSSPTPTLTFTSSRSNVTPGAGSATSTLNWSSSNASSCVASNGWTGATTTSGSFVVQPSATTTYTLLCGNGTASTSPQNVTVNFVPAATSTTVGHILISEVYDQPDASHGVNDTNEWIELYNPTNALVDLSNWTIKDATAAFDRIPNGTTIAAGGFLILTNSSTTPGFWGGMNGVQVIAFESALGSGLNNSDESLFLRNAATTTIDSLSWGANTDGFVSGNGAVDVLPGHSLVRSNLNVDTGTADDWTDDATPNPGQAN